MRVSVEAVQEKLQELGLDGWLLYVFRDVNPIAISMLELPSEQVRSRRAFYFIPAEGEPLKLQHFIEPNTLSSVPGEIKTFLSYTSLAEALKEILAGKKTIAMEYSPKCMIPTVSWVDGGTIELVRDCGVQIATSAELIQSFEATLTDDQIESHFRAAKGCRDIAHLAFEEIGKRLRDGDSTGEADIQAFIMYKFAEYGLITDHPPIVAANEHASDPHYEPTEERQAQIKPGDVVLIDLWAREDAETAIYADQTWMGWIGSDPIPEEAQKVWEIIRDARRAGWKLVEDRFNAGEPLHGWEVDDAVRKPIEDAGYGDYFIHRTGHSMTTVDHGSGANIDNLESKELRRLIPRTCFSIEPGVYLPKYGFRTEFNVLIDKDGKIRVAEGTDQEEMIVVNV